MEITLKVQPDVLISKATEISTEKTNIIGIMDQVKSDMGSLTGNWNSIAADEYQAKFKQLYNDMDNVFAILTEYVNDLNKAAEQYIGVEQRVRAVVDALAVDGVFKS